MSLNSINNIVFLPEDATILTRTGTRWLIFRDVPYLIKKYAKGKIALDYGCGSGTSTTFLTSCGLSVDGVDISQALISSAKQSDPTGRYLVIKSGIIPVDDCHYDVIFASGVLSYISSSVEMQKVLREIYRCLKVGGIFIASVGNKNTYQNDWNAFDGRFKENSSLRSGDIARIKVKEDNRIIHNYFWTDKDYTEFFAGTGLRVLGVHRPLGKDSDGFKWISEYTKSYCDIYVARKVSEDVFKEAL